MTDVKSFKDFSDWKTTFDRYLGEMLDEIKEDYLDGFGLSVVMDDKYNFSGKRWLAVYERRRGRIKDGVIAIGINYPKLYSGMCELGTDKDDFNIEAQARITIGHEIGHGLVDFLRSQDKTQASESVEGLVKVRRCSGRYEEALVEEFGESLFPEATLVWSSELGDVLRDYHKALSQKELKEDWGKTSPIPKETYKPVDWKDNFQWVDLGLPSGTLWADANLYNPADNRGFWRYDEIMKSPYREYVPTKEQMFELQGYSTWRWDENKKGYNVRSWYNSNETFLPAEGWRTAEGKVISVGYGGFYLTSTSYDDGYVNILNFGNGMMPGAPAPAISPRSFAYSVRLVKKK